MSCWDKLSGRAAALCSYLHLVAVFGKKSMQARMLRSYFFSSVTESLATFVADDQVLTQWSQTAAHHQRPYMPAINACWLNGGYSCSIWSKFHILSVCIANPYEANVKASDYFFFPLLDLHVIGETLRPIFSSPLFVRAANQRIDGLKWHFKGRRTKRAYCRHRGIIQTTRSTSLTPLSSSMTENKSTHGSLGDSCCFCSELHTVAQLAYALYMSW